MKKETRVVNIPKEDFDYIKKYCESKSLSLSKWMVKLAQREIGKENEKIYPIWEKIKENINENYHKNIYIDHVGQIYFEHKNNWHPYFGHPYHSEFISIYENDEKSQINIAKDIERLITSGERNKSFRIRSVLK